MRVIIATAALLAAALTFSAPAFAQAAGDGCSGSVKTTNAGGREAGTTNENPYPVTADVYLQGSGFPADLTSATYVIEDVNDGGAVVKTGTISPIAGGEFLQRIWTAGERAGIVGHEFKVTVTYPRTGQPDCSKSDNFFIVPGTFAPQVATAGAATAGGVAIVPTVACPRGVRVRTSNLVVGGRAVVRVSVRRAGAPVRNALVVLRGPGIRAQKATGGNGAVRFVVRATRRGVLSVYVPNVCVRRASAAGVAGAAVSGPALTG